MQRVIGVRFKPAGKIYYFDPNNIEVELGNNVIVETIRGIEYGTAVVAKEIDISSLSSPLKSIIKVANENDELIYNNNREKAKKALVVCKEMSIKHGLVMKLIDCEFTFDNAKVIFYFTAEGRIDFRELVKDLAKCYHTRIELRQVGARDYSKYLGGLGSCGYKTCCSNWANDFEMVSIKMAKEQNLSLNPSKISGVCGRLMCCLKYEYDHYKNAKKDMPKIGEIIYTGKSVSVVCGINLLEETISARKVMGNLSEQNIADMQNLTSVQDFENSQFVLHETIDSYKKDEIRRTFKCNKATTKATNMMKNFKLPDEVSEADLKALEGD